MSHPPPYPTPPYTQLEHMEAQTARALFVSALQVLQQPPPPSLRDILNAYKSKGDGDRDMLLAMLNAKSAEDQRIAATATLHQKLLDVRIPPHVSSHDYVTSNHEHVPSFEQSSPPVASQPAPTTKVTRSPPLPKMPSSSSSDVSLPSVNVPQNPRKRARSSHSPPPLKRRHSEQGSDQHAVAPSEQLPPSPPFSSPGRSTLGPELAAHPPPPRDAMAIGSLLSSGSRQQETDSGWPSRTSSERDREGCRRQAKVSG